MPSWKSLFSNTDRRFFPEVVVPLARDSASVTLESNTEKKDLRTDDPSGYGSNSDRGSVQEKGAAAVPATGKLTVESLHAEVEAGVVASGHDSIYDRMSRFLALCVSRGDYLTLSSSP